MLTPNISRTGMAFRPSFNRLFSLFNYNHNICVYCRKNAFPIKTFKLRLFHKNLYTIKPVINQRSFATTSKTNAIPPLVWLIAKPVTKIGAMIAGRGFRNWWINLPSGKRVLFKGHVIRNKYRYMVIISFTVGGSIYYYESHIHETPITHRKRFILFSSDHLVEIENLEKDQVFIEYKKKILDLYSPYTNRAVKVANRLFVANKQIPEVSAIQWKLTVIDNPAIANAVAFPSGDLVLFTGLLDFVHSDDELAVVLAHEMSHAILQHAAEEISHSRLVDIFSIAMGGLLWAFLPSDVTALITQYIADKFLKFLFQLPYSRQLEREADYVGIMLAARACFDVRCSIPFWKRMNDTEGNYQVPEILSTHPTSETRASDLEKLMPEALALRMECKCYELHTSFELFQEKFNKLLEMKSKKDIEKVK